MGGLSVGPLVFSAERAPVLAAILVAMLVAGLLARRVGAALNTWLLSALVAAALLGRIVFVASNWPGFAGAPWTILAFWQGGFDGFGAAAGGALATLWHLRRSQRLWLPALATLACAAITWNTVHQLARGGDMGLPAAMALTRLDGSAVPASDWQGKPIVINLWASWCAPCRREMPMMAEVAQQETQVPILFVNQGEGPGAIRRYLAQEGIAISALQDPGMQMMAHFQTMGLPATLFIDRDGKLRAGHMGEISRARLLSGIEDLR